MLDWALEYFKENLLQIFLGLVAGGWAVYKFNKSTISKSFSYDGEKTQLFTINDKNVGTLQFLFNGQAVTDPHVMKVTLFNSGNDAIAVSDYERPIKIAFSEGTQILSVAIIDQQPENINLNFVVEGNSINLQPFLLNDGDSITFKIVLEAASPSLTIDARIKGVKNVTRTKFKSSSEKRNSKILYLGLGLYLLGTILGFYAISIHDNSLARFAQYIIAGSMIPLLFLREPGGDFPITRILRRFFRPNS
jgi:hypothetical protein